MKHLFIVIISLNLCTNISLCAANGPETGFADGIIFFNFTPHQLAMQVSMIHFQRGRGGLQKNSAGEYVASYTRAHCIPEHKNDLAGRLVIASESIKKAPSQLSFYPIKMGITSQCNLSQNVQSVAVDLYEVPDDQFAELLHHPQKIQSYFEQYVEKKDPIGWRFITNASDVAMPGYDLEFTGPSAIVAGVFVLNNGKFIIIIPGKNYYKNNNTDFDWKP